VSIRKAHEGYIRRTIGSVRDEVKILKLGADSLHPADLHGGAVRGGTVQRLGRDPPETTLRG
jgi:hypothetical protein